MERLKKYWDIKTGYILRFIRKIFCFLASQERMGHFNVILNLITSKRNFPLFLHFFWYEDWPKTWHFTTSESYQSKVLFWEFWDRLGFWRNKIQNKCFLSLYRATAGMDRRNHNDKYCYNGCILARICGYHPWKQIDRGESESASVWGWHGRSSRMKKYPHK